MTPPNLNPPPLKHLKNLREVVQDAIKYQKRSMDKTEVTLKELCNASDVDATVKAPIFEYIQRHQAN
ncbi:hypothetical protein PABG_11392 [Paracoccidioides brasiliensis Pb03]|nr:hypothetical protein PABG_11392 [Paracoccidioides brasiliensis Pb03]